MLSIQDKKNIHQLCLDQLEESANVYLQNIKNAQLGLTSEVKSSAGDKHETGRAMLQLETEKSGAQYQEILKSIQFHKQMNLEESKTKIGFGSLIETNLGFFYITSGLGKIQYQNMSIFNLSMLAPISKELLGKSKGDEFLFNSKKITILSLI